MTLLEAQELGCWRGERLVFNCVSFAIKPGEALLLTGANGAGKSSLLRVVAGLLRAEAGKLLWNGEDALADLPAHGARLRYLGHQDALKPSFSVAENLALSAGLHGGDVMAALDALGVLPLAELPARVLSAGQRRRVALARLLLGTSRLWLLDEPSVGLDVDSVARLAPLFAAHRAAGGMVIAATHLPLPLPDSRELRL
ncbi:heme ABC exporter ATP-binding protein CcmA [Roseococcus sp. YIM B11640]|uniref:heme ABC exporter ATP-binding protein CcmA n=1 Tax=Roseococcus sp. YIM B11640 TaxID=3133973 RepID=UPI003C7DD29D